MATSPFRADAGVQMSTGTASWQGATGVGGIYYKTGVGLVMRKTDNSEVTLGAGGGSTGNYTFLTNTMDLSGAATATLFNATATGLAIGGSNLTSGFTLTGGAASTVTTTSGGLTLTAAGTVNVQNTSGAVVLGNTSGITSIRGGSTSSLDMSAGNGVFKTTSGTNTFGGAALFASTLDKAASGTWQIGNGNATTITYSSAQVEATGSAHIFDTANQYSAATNPVLHLKSAGHDLFKIFAGGSTTYMNAFNGTTGGSLSNLIFTAGAVQLGNAASVFAANADNGGTSGSSSVRWTASYSYWYDTKLGAQLTAAATITPTCALHHITGATPVNIIALTNVPASANTFITLIADSTITFGSSASAGGIKVAPGTTLTSGKAMSFVLDSSTQLWYPEQGA